MKAYALSCRYLEDADAVSTICVITQMSQLESIAREIGRHVREERRRQRMDQQTLALVASVGVRSVHRIEQGQPTVRLDIVLRVLEALGLRLEVQAQDQP
jgi:HTH-type transcriptional regulator / antitoxin HipB